MNEFDSLLCELRVRYPGFCLRREEPLRRHTTFRIGGPAAVMLLPASVEELCGALSLVHERELPFLILGNGSNLLVTDERLPMVVIKTGGLSGLKAHGSLGVSAECGVMMNRLAVFAMEKGLTGLEFAHGIPGTVGGGVMMNAGAYGGEIKDHLETVTFLNADGQLAELPAADCDLRYRHSCFEENGAVILKANFSLQPGDPALIRAEMDELMQRRQSKQPLNLPSAGSTFKRPANGYAAAMIEAAGLKGRGIGGARVSEKHAGFVVNAGGASFDDVIKTIELVQETVLRETGTLLEPEVRILR